MHKVLVVDDHAMIVKCWSRQLVRMGKQVSGAASFDEAVAIAREMQPDLSIVDLYLGPESRSGLDVMRELLALEKPGAVILVSQDITPTHTAFAMWCGALYACAKSPSCEHLVRMAETGKIPQPDITGPDLDLRRRERELLARALQNADNNKTKAARLLGLHRTTFCRMLEKHGLDPVS
jgi:ActR/RegA family two-component response regulator